MEYSEDKLPLGLDPITAAEIADDDEFVVGDASETPAGKVKGLSKSEMSKIIESVIPPHALGNHSGGSLHLIGSACGSATLSTGKLWAIPCFERKGSIINCIAVRRTAACAGVHIGIYSDLGSQRVPNQLIIDSGELNICYYPMQYWYASPLPFTIPYTGVFWFAMTIAGNMLMVTNDGLIDLLGWIDPHLGGDAMQPIFGVSAPFTYGSLPASFPSPITMEITNGHVPAMWKGYTAV